MKYQIDQSIKIEDTARNTYVCLANGKTVISSISAKEKRVLKLFFREFQKPLIFKLFTFSVLCATNIMFAQIKSVFIDLEYTQHERQIKSFILQILRIKNFPEIDINFSRIGKHSPAHHHALKASQTKHKGLIVTSKEVLIYYEKVNKK